METIKKIKMIDDKVSQLEGYVNERDALIAERKIILQSMTLEDWAIASGYNYVSVCGQGEDKVAMVYEGEVAYLVWETKIPGNDGAIYLSIGQNSKSFKSVCLCGYKEDDGSSPGCGYNENPEEMMKQVQEITKKLGIKTIVTRVKHKVPGIKEIMCWDSPIT